MLNDCCPTDAPRFTEALVHRTASKDQTLVLVCLSDANPPVSVYSWYRIRGGGQVRQATYLVRPESS